MTAIRIGLLRLVDSAPAIVAQARGLFDEQAIEAALRIEPSWANVLDKLAYGVLDAAVLPASLALAAALGLRGPAARIVVPLGLSRGGNSVVVAPSLAAAIADGGAAPLELGRRLAGWMAAQPSPPRFAVVHAFSTHTLLLRYWLAAAGADPGQIMQTVVVPPERVVDAMVRGQIAGFCAGAPWGDAAEAAGAGRVLLGGSAIWDGHPEKVLAVSQAWAEANPEALTRLLRALLRAGPLCDTAAEAGLVAKLLTQVAGLPEAACRAALPGGGGTERVRFASGAAWFPWRSHAAWLAAQMRRWGWLAPGQEAAAVAVYRPDLLRSAATAEGLPWPEAAEKPEGGHSRAWSFPADPIPLEMEADTFVDGMRFSPNGGQLPPRTSVTWAID